MKNNIVNKISKTIFILCFVFYFSGNVSAQTDTSFNRFSISIGDYLSLVGKNNLSYAAQKYNVNISEAQIEIAKVFPDPQLSIDAYNNEHQTLGLAYGYDGNIGTTIELGGKRKARINLAASQADLSKAQLNDFFRNLRANASLDYYNSLQDYFLFMVQLNSYHVLKQLADADSIRFKLGAIMEIDARQSRLEAASMLNNVFQSEANWKSALVQLSLDIGIKAIDTLYCSIGNFENLERRFSLDTLIITAQNNRADLIAAQLNMKVSQNNLSLIKANRVIDLGINAGASYNSQSTNNIAPTPPYYGVTGGISIPLKFSNAYKGDIKVADYTITQTELQYEQVLLQIQTEVVQAYYNYIAAAKQVQQFNTGLLNDAKKVLDGKIYSYRRGDTSLLDVLYAQQNYNTIQQSYYQTLYGYASALIQLESSAGIWDIK